MRDFSRTSARSCSSFSCDFRRASCCFRSLSAFRSPKPALSLEVSASSEPYLPRNLSGRRPHLLRQLRRQALPESRQAVLSASQLGPFLLARPGQQLADQSPVGGAIHVDVRALPGAGEDDMLGAGSHQAVHQRAEPNRRLLAVVDLALPVVGHFKWRRRHFAPLEPGRVPGRGRHLDAAHGDRTHPQEGEEHQHQGDHHQHELERGDRSTLAFGNQGPAGDVGSFSAKRVHHAARRIRHRSLRRRRRGGASMR